MELRLLNSLGQKVEIFKPLETKTVRIYSCGPTVYERAHIGNLASFIYADTLRRTLSAAGYKVKHVMNITDVDDKTIAASRKAFPDDSPMEALKKLTAKYEKLFLKDLGAVGVDVKALQFVRATDSIELMQALIRKLVTAGVAYIADDGIYFSISIYKTAGKTYGQLVKVSADSTKESRIDNDDYDKDNAHDFALWKAQKSGEPAWDFEIEGQSIKGRPGWHIECSAMSVHELGQPFDIHTGGVDLKFPHHENEIAQSTAVGDNLLAKLFLHSEHLLVDDQKMSKSLNNFYTLDDVRAHGFEPLTFRLFVLQSHYRSQAHFSWQNLEHAANRLKHWRQVAAKWRQMPDTEWAQSFQVNAGTSDIWHELSEDLDTPTALEKADSEFDRIDSLGAQAESIEAWTNLLGQIETLFGLDILEKDPTIDKLVAKRETARKKGDWELADDIRQRLEEQGIGINDTDSGPVWYRL